MATASTSTSASSSSSSSAVSVAPANIRVMVRVRPLNSSELKERGAGTGMGTVLHVDTRNMTSRTPIDFNASENSMSSSSSSNSSSNSNSSASISVLSSSSSSGNEGSGSGHMHKYMFDAVHDEQSTQTEVYDSVRGIVDAVTAGYNGTIVAYGQTGSGKTHTVFGNGVRSDEAGSGLVQRSLRDIFKTTEMRGGAAVDQDMPMDGSEDETKDDGEDGEQIQSSKTTFKGSFFEIFNERVYDLFLAYLHYSLMDILRSSTKDRKKIEQFPIRLPSIADD